MKRLKNILISLRLALTLLLLLIVMLFIGTYMMPLNEAFQSINSIPLINWLLKNPLSFTWWLWVSIAILLLLSLNTLICSIDSILKKKRLEGWLMIISPQVIHMGFLFILVAHLISSLEGFREYGVITEGTIVNIGSDEFIRFERIEIESTKEGYITDWSIKVSRLLEGNAKSILIKPNRPLFTGGVGIYVRDMQAYPVKAALIEISKDPGAIWALLGAILFFSGTVSLMILRLKRDKDIKI